MTNGHPAESQFPPEQRARVLETMLSAIADYAYLFDREGRFLYANRVLTELLGLPLEDLVGKRFTELPPYPRELAEKLLRQVLQVFEIGEPLTDETTYTSPAGRTGVYEYIFRPVFSADGRSVEFVAGSTRDITERIRAERDAAFLATVSDHLARLWTADEIMATLGEKIGAHLGLSVCAFMDIDEAADAAVVTRDWHRPDTRSLAGAYRISEYVTGEFQRASRAGEVFVVRDTATDPRADGPGYAAIGVGAFVSVPVVRDGAWRFLLVMFDSAPRAWRDDEIGLMRELTARLWTRLERARGEEALRRSEAGLRAVFESARDFALITMDVGGRVTAWNPGAETIFGCAAARMLGSDARLLFLPEDQTARVLEAEMARAGADGHAGNDRWMQRCDGGRFWASGSVMPLQVRGAAPHGFLKILRDMTAVHQMERARRQAEDRFALVVQSVRDYAIYMLDAGGLVTTWNEGAERIKGYTASEAIGQPFASFFNPAAVADGEPARELDTAAREGRFHGESWRTRKDGTQYWADELLVALRGAEGELIAYAKFCRDLTERKRHEDERTRLLAAEQTARADAEAASKAKDHFLAVLSHELRTPLTPVLMAAHVLLRDPKLPPAARAALEMIERNVRIEARFIDDLLDLTRITRGKLELARAPLDLRDTVRQAVEITAPDLAEKGQRLTVTLADAGHALTGDAARLQQVFWNLLKNASKFTPEGGSIRVVSRREPGRLVVEVADTGIGFEAGAEARIFDPFTQASEEITRRFGGLGLGLAISKATVDAHGGELRARSDGPGRGATFTVELPMG